MLFIFICVCLDFKLPHVWLFDNSYFEILYFAIKYLVVSSETITNEQQSENVIIYRFIFSNLE